MASQRITRPKHRKSGPDAPLTPPASDLECPPYDMDEVASLFWKFYRLLADMAYIFPGDIKFPEQRSLSPSLLTRREVANWGLDPQIAELIKKIPYIDPSLTDQQIKRREFLNIDPSLSLHVEVLPHTKIVMYGTYQALEDSRVNHEYIDSWKATIWMSEGSPLGTNIVFDTKTGEISGFQGSDRRPPHDGLPPLHARPAFYYRGHYTLPALKFFADLMADFRILKVAPWKNTILDYDNPLLPYIQHIYKLSGWPKRFRKEKFRVLCKHFNDWLEAHDGDLDYEVDEKNQDTHFEENCARVFEEAEITFKGRKFRVRKEELATIGENAEEGIGSEEAIVERIEAAVGNADESVVDQMEEVAFEHSDEAVVAEGHRDHDSEQEPVPRKERLRGGNQTLWGPIR